MLSISIGSLYHVTLYHILSFLLAIIFILLLIYIDKRSHDGLFPKGTFSFSAPLSPIYLTMALLGISVQTEVFVPYFLQMIHGITPLLSGYLAALVGAGWSFSAIISSSQPSGIAQRLMRIGPAINFTAIIVLGLLISNYLLLPYGQVIIICLALFLQVQELAWLGLIISLVYYRFLKGKKRKKRRRQSPLFSYFQPL